jgi:formylglycine-generating enzyme required for sulfatase activity
MKFVPVPITGGPTSGQRVLFSIWETRVASYEFFATVTKREWPKPGFDQGPTHPAVNVSWEDATAFCAWMTEAERKAGRLGGTEVYRLPSDHEWSCAVGIGDREDPAQTPREKVDNLLDVFPWGSVWPPPSGAGNYASEGDSKGAVITGYRDGFPFTAPVGSFAANPFGLFDLGGNAWEWVEDWLKKESDLRVTRGASWKNEGQGIRSSARGTGLPGARMHNVGFRVVLAPVP